MVSSATRAGAARGERCGPAAQDPVQYLIRVRCGISVTVRRNPGTRRQPTRMPNFTASAPAPDGPRWPADLR